MAASPVLCHIYQLVCALVREYLKMNVIWGMYYVTALEMYILHTEIYTLHRKENRLLLFHFFFFTRGDILS